MWGGWGGEREYRAERGSDGDCCDGAEVVRRVCHQAAYRLAVGNGVGARAERAAATRRRSRPESVVAGAGADRAETEPAGRGRGVRVGRAQELGRGGTDRARAN